MGPPLVVVVSVYDVDMRVQLLKSVEFCLKLLAVVFSKLVGKERLHMPLKLVLFNFYATESQGGRLNIYYYRKSSWERLINKEISKTLEGYILVDNAEAENRRKMLGLSKFRILPKANGVRMVLDFSSSSRLQSLRDTHAVLKDIQIKEPDVLGSSVFDHDDFYRNLGPLSDPFEESIRRTSSFVLCGCADVFKAFDSIDLGKLLHVIESFLKDEYILNRCRLVCCGKRSNWVLNNILVSSDKNASFSRFTSTVPYNALQSVMVDQVCFFFLT